MNYSRLNNITGWVAFALAMVTYLGTVAPTASFWDCGEFIACANELQVPHPPGAPLFLLLGRLFAMFAPSVERIAFMINMLSALSSAFTVLFVFWTITALARRMMVERGQDPSQTQTVTIMFAGLVGALTCTFSDSFWFNAVEAEVYAMSSFFTALVVWLMFKWDARADEPHSNRWLILIAYVMGLSIGVHLLNLLTIPALAFMYYTRRANFTWMGAIITMGISIVILALIQYGIIQSTFDLMWVFEKVLVGTSNQDGTQTSGLGMPYGTGAWLFFLLLFGGIAYGIWYSQKKQKVNLNIALISTLVIYVGFSSYMMIFVRASKNIPINENAPNNILGIRYYMKREQYGDRPLFYGPMYSERPTRYDKGDENFVKISGTDRYIKDGFRDVPVYAKKKLFPRMHAVDHYGDASFGYKQFVSKKGANPDDPYDDKPTNGEDIAFFWEYQFVHMYVRYFMWNFAGRADDIQDSGWESVPPSQENMPEWMKDKPTANHYFMLPFLLGLLGAYWHFSRRWKDATMVAMLFFFTGIAIIIYLNQTPEQPRERDYSYAGSFQTFAIWVGLGVVALHDWLSKYLKGATAWVTGSVSLAAVPLLMVVQNWDDHSRANNFAAPDSARNLLESCEKNALLFTNGDNDTFPLWYLQEVEGVRTDVRVVNLMLLNTDWFIKMLLQQSNESAPVPITIPEWEWIGEHNAYASWTKKTIPLTVDKQQLVENGVVSKDEIWKVESPLVWNIKTHGGPNNPYLLKQDLMIVNIMDNIAKDGWKRPVYFANTIPPSSYLGLNDYFVQEGLAYRVVPIRQTERNPLLDPFPHGVNREKMYDNLVNKFQYRNLNDTTVFYDANTVRMVGNFKSAFIRLAGSYTEDAKRMENAQKMADAQLSAGQVPSNKIDSVQKVVNYYKKVVPEYKAKAIEILNICNERMSETAVPSEPFYLYVMGITYEDAGDNVAADKWMSFLTNRLSQELKYYRSIRRQHPRGEYYMQMLAQVYQYYSRKGNKDQAEKINLLFQELGV